MNILNTFEDRVSAIFDTTSQGFRAPFSFKKLAKQAIREMDKETFVVNGVDTAPALFTILVSPVDDVAIRPFYTKLTKEIQQLVEAQAERKHSSFIGEPLVRFMVDQSLRSGRFSVFAENVDARTLRRLHAEEDTFLDSLGARRTRGRATPDRGGEPQQQQAAEAQAPGRAHAPGSRAGERQAKRAAHGATSANSTAQAQQKAARTHAQRAESDALYNPTAAQAQASTQAAAAAGRGAASLNPLPSMSQALSPTARAAQAAAAEAQLAAAQAAAAEPQLAAAPVPPVAPTMKRATPVRPTQAAGRANFSDLSMDPEASGDYAAVVPASGYVPPLSTGAAGMLPAAGGASFGSYSRSRDQRLSATFDGSIGLFGRHPLGAVAQAGAEAPVIQPGPQQSYLPFPEEEPEPEPEEPKIEFWKPTPVPRPVKPAEEPEEDRFNPQPEEDAELNEPPKPEEEHEPVAYEPKAAQDPFAAKFSGIMDLEDDPLAGPYHSMPNLIARPYEPQLDDAPAAAQQRSAEPARTAFEPPKRPERPADAPNVPAPSPRPAPIAARQQPAAQPQPATVPQPQPQAQPEPAAYARERTYSATPHCMLIDRQSGHTYTASAPGATLGRERGGGGIVLADPNISRRHAELAWDGANWHIIDLGSTNGTLVNNTDVRDCVLADGDVVTLGLINLEFREVMS